MAAGRLRPVACLCELTSTTGVARRPQISPGAIVPYRPAGTIGSMLRDVLDAFLPRNCAGCGSAGVGLCEACGHRFVGEAALPLPAEAITPTPPAAPVAGAASTTATVTVTTTGRYAATTRALLLAYKERGRRDLAPVLGDRLAMAIRFAAAAAPSDCRPLLVVGVPASPGALRRRGFDHVAELVRAAPGVPAPSRVLRWRRRVADQTALDASARAANVAGALVVRQRWRRSAEGFGRPPGVLLVDDVVTTGATLREAGRACRAAGFPVVGAVAVAGTPFLRRARVPAL